MHFQTARGVVSGAHRALWQALPEEDSPAAHAWARDLNLQLTERETPRANELLRKCSTLLITGKIPWQWDFIIAIKLEKTGESRTMVALLCGEHGKGHVGTGQYQSGRQAWGLAVTEGEKGPCPHCLTQVTFVLPALPQLHGHGYSLGLYPHSSQLLH